MSLQSMGMPKAFLRQRMLSKVLATCGSRPRLSHVGMRRVSARGAAGEVGDLLALSPSIRPPVLTSPLGWPPSEARQ